MTPDEQKEEFAKQVLKQINSVIFTKAFPEDAGDEEYEMFNIYAKKGRVMILNMKSVMPKIKEKANVPDEWIDHFYKRMAGHYRYKQGVWAYAFKITYDQDKKAFYVDNKCEATVRVTNERNRAWAYVSIGEGEQGSYRVRAERLDDFLYGKGIEAKTVRFTKDSIDTFYAYVGRNGRRYFVNQTRAIKEARRASQEADFWRLDINKSSHDNAFGFTFAVWEDHLVENSGGVYVSDGMTDEDYDIVMAGYNPGSYFEREVTRIYKASDTAVQKAMWEVKEKQKDFQAVIDKHEEDIMAHMMKRAGIDPVFKHDAHALHAASERYGLDCGWVHFKFLENKGMDEAVKNASLSANAVGIYPNGTFSLSLPYGTQSTTIQGFEAEAATELIEKECGEKLGFVVTLD